MKHIKKFKVSPFANLSGLVSSRGKMKIKEILKQYLHDGLQITNVVDQLTIIIGDIKSVEKYANKQIASATHINDNDEFDFWCDVDDEIIKRKSIKL